MTSSWVGPRTVSAAEALVGQVDERVAHGLIAARLFPEVERLHRRHVQFDRPGSIHLLADDVLDFSEDTVADRQIGIRPSRDLADETSPQHKLMGGDHRIGGRFL